MCKIEINTKFHFIESSKVPKCSGTVTSKSRLILLESIIILIITNQLIFSHGIKYRVNGTGCKIPEFPIFPHSILPEWSKNFSTNCEHLDPLSFVVEHDSKKFIKLRSAQEVLEYTCCWREIQRPELLVSDKYILTECEPMNSESYVDISEIEFALVNCSKIITDEDESESEKPRIEFHYNFPKHFQRLKSKINFWRNELKEFNELGIDRPFSIALLVFDSVSGPNALRSFPKSLKFMKEELDFIEVKGHHSFSESTIENFIPMFLGIKTDYENWNRKHQHFDGNWDNEPFIWKNFSDINYITMHVEDMPTWHTLNMQGRTGFSNQTFDFSTRPYFLIQDQHSSKSAFNGNSSTFQSYSYEVTNCIHGKNVFDFMFDYTKEFFEAFDGLPRFSISWWAWPNPNYLTAAQVLDDPLTKFFKYLRDFTSVMNDTIFILVGKKIQINEYENHFKTIRRLPKSKRYCYFLDSTGDHGFRWSDYYSTPEGQFERSLAPLWIRLPPGFNEYFPDQIDLLKQNAERIPSSHLDLFETLAHLHSLLCPIVKDLPSNGKNGKPYYGYDAQIGKSLLKYMPSTRNCETAFIDADRCACHENITLIESEETHY